MKQLTIISHTEHYTTASGALVGFGATVTEINHLLEVFDTIVHVAVLYDGLPPASALPYSSKRIRFVPLPTVGGRGLIQKLRVVWKAPHILKVVHNSLKGSSHFQFRAPTGMGVYIIPYLIFFNKKKGWFKYAGSWNQQQVPLTYRLQRWLLKKQARKVTINGQWPNQPKHCLSFENPCLTQEELQEGIIYRKTKVLILKKVSFCFVGRLDASKGVDLFIDSLKALPESYKGLIDGVHFVGTGNFGEDVVRDLADLGIAARDHGTLPRHKLHAIYKTSHFIVLPSKSEGFPKVISEALNYGCIPVVSYVSAIGQYIYDGIQGILIEELTKTCLMQKLKQCITMKPNMFKQIISQPEAFYDQFSYSNYNNRILKEILHGK